MTSIRNLIGNPYIIEKIKTSKK